MPNNMYGKEFPVGRVFKDTPGVRHPWRAAPFTEITSLHRGARIVYFRDCIEIPITVYYLYDGNLVVMGKILSHDEIMWGKIKTFYEH